MEPGEGSRLGKPWRRGILIPQDLELSLELFSEVRKGSAAPALGGRGGHMETRIEDCMPDTEERRLRTLGRESWTYKPEGFRGLGYGVR